MLHGKAARPPLPPTRPRASEQSSCMDDINAVLLTTSTRTIYTNLAGDVSFVRQLLTSDSKIITIIIKSNQIFFSVQEDAK